MQSTLIYISPKKMYINYSHYNKYIICLYWNLDRIEMLVIITTYVHIKDYVINFQKQVLFLLHWLITETIQKHSWV